MIYTGEGLRVRICARPTHYHHWMSFACYTSMRRFLPDAEIELAVFGRVGFYFNWASRLHLKVLRRKDILPAPIIEVVEAESGMLVVTSDCMAVRQWDDDRLLTNSMSNRTGTACLKRSGDCDVNDLLCDDAKQDSYAPLADVSKGVGAFVQENWLDRNVCFLTHISRFGTGKETSTELAVLNEWRRAANLASSLGLNQA